MDNESIVNVSDEQVEEFEKWLFIEVHKLVDESEYCHFQTLSLNLICFSVRLVKHLMKTKGLSVDGALALVDQTLEDAYDHYKP